MPEPDRSAQTSPAAPGPAPAAAPAGNLVRLLGPPAIQEGAVERPFSDERPYQLLAYLAARSDWVRRDELADLLYPGRELDAARRNLRKVLHLARKVEGVGAIDQRDELLRWAPDSDLRRFERACDAGRLAEALACYGGPLLQGMGSGWSPAGAEWLQAERQRLEARWHEAALRRLKALDGEPQAAEALAQQLLRHDPLDDTAMQALLAAQGRLGRAAEALQQLDGYSRALAGQLGLAPSAALQQIEGSLRRGAKPPPAVTVAQPEQAPIIGRRHELAQIRERLSQPGCRLLTVLGPGGIGKTALARAAHDQVLAPLFPAGSAWVALESVSRVEELPALVASAFGAAPPPQEDRWSALAAALNARGPSPFVLVLDNLEHLDAAALGQALESVLAKVPALRIVATSRTALGIAAEWRLPLAGLPLPDADERDSEVLRANDAVRLFEHHALPLAPDFRLEHEAAEVVRLVHEVEGMPLALRLLAGWRRLMPVREILDELATSLDLLEPSTPQDRSVRAAFARSWQQLGAHEQRVLAQMALLPQPLDRGLLRGVLAAPLVVLAALADRSLVRAEGDGRFTLHPLIRRLAAPLASDAEAVLERHARHVAHALRDSAHVEADQAAHLLAAWHWGVAHAEPGVLEALADALNGHHNSGARYRDGLATMRLALHALEPAPGAAVPPAGDACERARLRILIGLADMLYACGELDGAREAAEQALRIGERRADGRRAAKAHGLIGRVHWQRGDYRRAREHMHGSLVLLRALGAADIDTVPAIAGLGLTEKSLGDFDAALAHYREAMDVVRAHGQLAHHLGLANNMASLLRTTGRIQESLALLHEALDLAQAQGQVSNLPFLLVNLAFAHESANDLVAAMAAAERAVAACREHGQPYIEAAALLGRARVGAWLGRPAEQAGPDIRAALAIAARVRLVPLAVQCLATAGLVHARSGHAAAGLAIVMWAMEHPEFARSEREDAQARMARLAPSADLLSQARVELPADTALELVIQRLPPAWRP